MTKSDEDVETKAALLDSIRQAAGSTKNATNLVKLAEAYAYTVCPNNAHGGSNAQPG
jgi:hypothetical protein